MKKTLGKKASVQSGTLVAFGNCDCNADCRMLGCDCTPNTSPSSTLAIQNYCCGSYHQQKGQEQPTHAYPAGECAWACPYFVAAVGATADNRPKAAPWLHWAHHQRKNVGSGCGPGNQHWIEPTGIEQVPS